MLGGPGASSPSRFRDQRHPRKALPQTAVTPPTMTPSTLQFIGGYTHSASNEKQAILLNGKRDAYDWPEFR